MGFQFNGTQANVTLSGSVGLNQPNASQTPVSYSADTGGTGNVDFYQVPVGKTLYLTGINCSGGAGANTFYVFADNGTTQYFKGIAPANGELIYTPCTPIATYASGEHVVVKTLAASTAVGITGFLV